MKALIVEDSETIRRQLSALLARHLPDAEVLVAHDATRARTLVREHVVDLAFVDLVLMDGVSGLTAVRSILQANPDAKVVIVTGLGREHPDVVAATSHGARGFLRKPIWGAEFEELMRRLQAETEPPRKGPQPFRSNLS